MSFEAAIFDYEGVLVEMNRARAVAFFRERSPLSVKAITQRWELWCADQVGDHLPAMEMWHAFWESLRTEVDIAEPVLAEIYSFDYIGLLEACPDALDALCEAKRLGLRVGILSNTVLPKLVSPSAPIDLWRLADIIRVPGRGMPIKPAREAYLDIARSLGASPERCLFFDNEPTFVQAACEAGMRGYLVSRGAGTPPGAQAVLNDLSGFRALVEGGSPASDEKA
jgi:FMN phosphatase YigB (HAD superfamily)